MSNVTLVSAMAGLTNYYNPQVIRNPAMNIHTQLIDELTMQNHNGGINPASLLHTAVMSGGLNIQASSFANIKEGWNETKGLLKLDMVTQDSPVMVEYMHVLGYITNNASTAGLTRDAEFHPVMSWRSQETVTTNIPGMGLDPTSIQRKIGGRTDYMFNDGAAGNDLVTLRPSDVIDYGLEKATEQDLQTRMDEEGLSGIQPQVQPAGSSIDRAGVIASRRNNTNPSSYATDILKAGTNLQRNTMISSNSMDVGVNMGNWDGLFGELGNLSYQAQRHEPQMLRDPFFAEMMENLGYAGNLKGFTGYRIGDLAMVFDNFNDVLDLTILTSEQFTSTDYTQDTESFGTSSLVEVVATEIEVNILDLLLKHGLNMISFRGSNCDNFGDGGLDNIVIFPYNPASLEDDDVRLYQKTEAFVEDLRSQIFTKLNGLNINGLTPIRFQVDAELFGTTCIDIAQVDDTNIGNGFSTEEAGQRVGKVHMFPTFAINATSPILGHSEDARVAGSNFFSNVQQYFSL